MSNPVPSNKIIDLKSNAESVDQFVNSNSLNTTTRTGKQILTIEGILAEARSLGGLIFPPIEYAAGLEITTTNQTYSYNAGTGNVVYNWVGDLPHTTTGDFESETGWNVIQRYFRSDTIIERRTGEQIENTFGVFTLENITYIQNKNQILVLNNGIKLRVDLDYTETSPTTITLTTAFMESDLFSLDSDIEVMTVQNVPEAGQGGEAAAGGKTILDYGAVLNEENAWSANEDAIEAMSADTGGLVVFPSCTEVNPLWLRRYETTRPTKFMAQGPCYVKMTGAAVTGFTGWMFDIKHPYSYFDSNIFLDCMETGRGGVQVREQAYNSEVYVHGKNVALQPESNNFPSLLITGADNVIWGINATDCNIRNKPTGFIRAVIINRKAKGWIGKYVIAKNVTAVITPMGDLAPERVEGHIEFIYADNYEGNGIYSSNCNITFGDVILRGKTGFTQQPIASRTRSILNVDNMACFGPSGAIVGVDKFSTSVTVNNIFLGGLDLPDDFPDKKIQTYGKSSLVRGRAVEGNDVSEPAGTVTINNVTGTLMPERLMDFEPGIRHRPDYVTVKNLDIDLIVESRRWVNTGGATPSGSAFMDLRNLGGFNFENWTIRVLDNDDWLGSFGTPSAPFAVIPQFATNYDSISYWNSIDVFVYTGNGEDARNFIFQANPFRESIFQKGNVIRSRPALSTTTVISVNSLSAIGNARNVVTNAFAPASGYWRQGDSYMVLFPDRDGIMTRLTCVESGSPGVWELSTVSNRFAHWKGTLDSSGLSNAADINVNCNSTLSFSAADNTYTVTANFDIRPDTLNIRAWDPVNQNRYIYAMPNVQVTNNTNLFRFRLFAVEERIVNEGTADEYTDQRVQLITGADAAGVRIEAFIDQCYSRGAV